MKSNNRVWEIDFLRGFAIFLMIFDHLFFDLMYKYDIFIPLVSNSTVYSALQAFFAGCFILLSGISSTFSRSNLKRGSLLLSIALLLTAITSGVETLGLVSEGFTIVFGILHFLAVCMLIASFMIKINKYVLVLIGAIILLLNPAIDYINALISSGSEGWFINFASNNYLMIFGIYNKYTFSSGDYFPLIPWAGIFILGIACAKFLYKEKKSLIKLKPNFFNYIGRYSIWIYLAHQPILMGVLWLIFGY